MAPRKKPEPEAPEVAAEKEAAQYKPNGALPRGTREAILGANDLEREDVEVPEWGCVVTVQGLTGRQRAELERMVAPPGAGGTSQPDYGAFYGALVQMAVVDPDTGQPLFDRRDRDMLVSKSAKAFNRVAVVAGRLAGFGAEQMREAVKNSGTDPNDGSTSA